MKQASNNVKKLYHKEKRAKQTKKPATGEFFFTFAPRFSTFRDIFKLVKRAFCGGNIMFSEINLVHN